MLQLPILTMYFDNAAITEIRKEISSVSYGNPSSSHTLGIDAKRVLDSARLKVAKILNCNPSEIIFTGSGTESINLALQGFFSFNGFKGHMITCKTEHKAVLETCKYLESNGVKVTYLDVNSDGLIDLSMLEKSIGKDTKLISIMYVNNETGVVQDISSIVSIAHKYGVKVHTDACAAGLFDLDVGKMMCDMLSLNSSKIYGPRSVGLLYLKQGINVKPIIFGGEQEFGLRSGTENVSGIVGFSYALELIQKERKDELLRLKLLREKLIDGLKNISGIKINGNGHPGIVNISFKDVEYRLLLDELDKLGIYASSGSACNSSTLDPSHVILALGVPLDYALGTVRFSFGKYNMISEIDKLVSILSSLLPKLRGLSVIA